MTNITVVLDFPNCHYKPCNLSLSHEFKQVSTIPIRFIFMYSNTSFRKFLTYGALFLKLFDRDLYPSRQPVTWLTWGWCSPYAFHYHNRKKPLHVCQELHFQSKISTFGEEYPNHWSHIYFYSSLLFSRQEVLILGHVIFSIKISQSIKTKTYCEII